MGWEGQKEGFAEIKPERHVGVYTTIGVSMPTRIVPPTRIREKVSKTSPDASSEESISESVEVNQEDASPSETISESVEVTSP